ncbi:MAG: phosphoribosyltransferase [Promethearchaeota archaeon]|nr:MAG: phosphoribosyltransferase [Candidatus Lokiarchaeota archaeon]
MKFERYDSRFKAGEILAELIKEKDIELYNSILKNSKNFFCFAIPNGGVPVAEGFCSKFNINYDMLIVRKIKIPWNTEAGFGSITTDGSVLINKPLLNQLSLSEEELNKAINLTRTEIKERLQFYNKETNLEDIYKKIIHQKHIFMIDDGLASGFTMLAAIRMVQKYNPKKIFIAVPTAPLHTIQRIQSAVKFDELFCPNIRNVWRFAVADAYKAWRDLSEDEIVKIIENSKFYMK